MMRWGAATGATGAPAGLAAAAAAALLPSASERNCASAGAMNSARASDAEPAQNSPLFKALLVEAKLRTSRHSSFGAGSPPSFRKDSAEPGHSRWSGASTPRPRPTQAEIQRPGPAHQAAAPKQLRIHSTEDARRRGAELEKDWQARCL